MSRIVVNEARCKGCALCTLVCPYDLIRVAHHFNARGYRPAEQVDPDEKCTGCADCAMMCPDVAITVYRTRKRRVAQASQGTQRWGKAAQRPAQGTRQERCV